MTAQATLPHIPTARDIRLAEMRQLAKQHRQTAHCQIHTASAREMIDIIPAASIDVLITDPPYARRHIDCWADLRDLALHSLVPGGHLVAVSGSSSLQQVMCALADDGLVWMWDIQIEQRQGTMMAHLPIISRRRPLLWWRRRGAWRRPDNGIDIIADDTPDDIIPPLADGRGVAGDIANLHIWEQPINQMRAIVRRFCDEGDVVLDPFCGSGTTGIAALEHGCKVILSDIHPEDIKTTKGRIQLWQRHSN